MASAPRPGNSQGERDMSEEQKQEKQTKKSPVADYLDAQTKQDEKGKAKPKAK